MSSAVIGTDLRVSGGGTGAAGEVNPLIEPIICETIGTVAGVSIANQTIRQGNRTIVAEASSICTTIVEQSVVGTILTQAINLTVESPFALETVLWIPVTVETMIDELVAPFSDTWQR